MNQLDEYYIYLASLDKEELRQKYLDYVNSDGYIGIHSGFVMTLLEKRINYSRRLYVHYKKLRQRINSAYCVI